MATACSGFRALRGIDLRGDGADRAEQGAVGPGDGHPCAVHALDQAVADDLDEDRIDSEGVGHGMRL